MNASLVAACWAAVALCGLMRRAPFRTRRPTDWAGPATSLGRIVRTGSAWQRVHRFDESDDPALGRTVIAGAIALIVHPAVSGLVIVGGYIAVIARARRRRHPAPADPLALSTAVDVLVVATTAGLDARRAVEAVSDRLDPPFDRSFADAVARLRSGGSRDTAWRTALAPAGRLGHRVAHAIDDAERDGTSLRATLVRASTDLEREGRRQAEQRARRLPVQLLFPLVSCILPAFALLTVVPLLAGSLSSLPS